MLSLVVKITHQQLVTVLLIGLVSLMGIYQQVMQVQAGVQVIKDKQGIVEGQLHHARLLVSRVGQHSEAQNTVQSDSFQLAASAPQQSHQELPPPVIVQPSSTLSIPNAPPPIVKVPSTLPPPNVPPSASQQNLPPLFQLPNQLLLNQIPSVPQREPYFPSPSQIQEVTNPQYQLPPQQPQRPVPAAPQQQYQPPPPPPPPYSQPPPPPQQHPSLLAVPSQPQLSLGHHPDETPCASPQNYPPSLRQPPHPPNANTPSQQFYGAARQMYEPPSVRSNSGYSAAYEPYPYSGSPSQYGSGSLKRLLSSAAAQSGGSGYPQLSTARTLPHALPTASGVGSGSGSVGTGNKVPIDDVVDRVTNMGFPRDQVRATVRKLTENGQSVDLNVVLDKLMNNGC